MPYMISFLPRVRVSLEMHWYQPVKSDQKETAIGQNTNKWVTVCSTFGQYGQKGSSTFFHFVMNSVCIKYVVNYFILKH